MHIRPNFKVDMGFGLHHGWAIEGAIGSYDTMLRCHASCSAHPCGFGAAVVAISHELFVSRCAMSCDTCRVHKVDVSYLSPHVNMSARLEAATKQFGVPMLLSGSFVKLLSPEVK